MEFLPIKEPTYTVLTILSLHVSENIKRAYRILNSKKRNKENNTWIQCCIFTHVYKKWNEKTKQEKRKASSKGILLPNETGEIGNWNS
jgi:hypothetical protein